MRERGTMRKEERGHCIGEGELFGTSVRTNVQD
jgi:hypothetical protein